MIEKESQIEVQQQVSLALDIRPDAAWEEWIQTVAARINRLIETDFPGLVQLLYRLDVSESRIRKMLAGKTGKDAGSVIAELVVERQLEKIRTRRQFRSSNDIPDDEKW